MKREWIYKLVLGLCLLIGVETHAQHSTAGIVFFEGSWQELLAEAKKTGKPFFVDFYTDWCGPCKMLEKNTFRNKEVGDFANKNYIAYRINAEKGEGIELADKYRIRAYPSIYFFDSEGRLVEKVIGYHTPDRFLYVMEQILAKIK
ncbi:MAG: hypothetical protein KatS3mg033_1427 [Thermonema sp.]|uniref:thioredoxin family protein n=1 Tax=Thermonema TaxID=28194 RepID=UPI000571D44F|nr:MULTISPECIES: thioredoxin fold domain-containing protein [Thermonema]GIV39627.1 MAG: hypothetical protein KatS3mg033_1427 [Thermonema sp.]